MPPLKIAPSILAADFARLGEQVADVADHVELLHLDVMDGHFVPNISFGFPVIEALRAQTELFFDCHMMTTNPGSYVAELKAVGCDLMSVHIEVVPDPTELADQVRQAGLGFGLVLNPPTPHEAVAPYLELCDQVLVMSVDPGFGGQEFIPDVLPKIRALRELVDSRGLGVDIEIDGGINPQTAAAAIEAGANVLVAGTAIFGSENPRKVIDELRQT